MEVYPYTIIYPDKIKSFYDILVAFGYESYEDLNYFLRRCSHRDTIYVVINDTNIFGRFCFYKKDEMSNQFNRTFISDPYKFLKMAAKYKGHLEY